MACAELDEALPYWNPMTKRCVASCPAGLTPYEDTPHTCKSCTSQFFDPVEEICANECPETSDANGLCVSCAEATNGVRPFWDKYELKCVE